MNELPIVPVGVPVMVFPTKLSPAGKEPINTLQETGPTPLAPNVKLYAVPKVGFGRTCVVMSSGLTRMVTGSTPVFPDESVRRIPTV